MYAALSFVVFSFRYSKDFLHPGFGVFIENVIQSLTLSLGIVGRQELDRLGHRRVGEILIFCIIPISIALFFVLIFRRGYSANWFCAGFTLFAVPFPVALYLNRKRPESTSQPKIVNAP
jgi:hypothetical protein